LSLGTNFKAQQPLEGTSWKKFLQHTMRYDLIHCGILMQLLRNNRTFS